MTSQPTNDSELQLYRVLQRANLLNYYDTFISQGEREGGTIQNNQHTKYWRKGIHALSCWVTALKCKFNNYIARKQGEWKITKCLLNPSKGEIINEFQWSFIKSSFSLAECWLPAPKCSTLLVAFSPLCTDNFTWFAVASRKSLFYRCKTAHVGALATRASSFSNSNICESFLQNINPAWSDVSVFLSTEIFKGSKKASSSWWTISALSSQILSSSSLEAFPQ